MRLNLNRTARRLFAAGLRQIPAGADRLLPAFFDAREVTSHVVLDALRLGLVPHDTGDSLIEWETPERRALMSIEEFHVPKNVARLLRNQRFDVSANRDFSAIVAGCAELVGKRSSTWLSAEIQAAFIELHALGAAHSVECRREGALVGGLFGVAMGSYFITLSQFHRVRDASKVALATLNEILQLGSFETHDVVYPSPHLAQFGCTEISRAQLGRILATCSVRPASFVRGFELLQAQESQRVAQAS